MKDSRKSRSSFVSWWYYAAIWIWFEVRASFSMTGTDRPRQSSQYGVCGVLRWVIPGSASFENRNGFSSASSLLSPFVSPILRPSSTRQRGTGLRTWHLASSFVVAPLVCVQYSALVLYLYKYSKVYWSRYGEYSTLYSICTSTSTPYTLESTYQVL